MRYLSVIGIVLWGLMVACSDVDLESYHYDHFIQFEKSSKDSTIFSFAYDETLQSGTVKLKMNLISPLSDRSRKFKIAFLEKESSAKAGVDFELPVETQEVMDNDSVAWFVFTVKRNPALTDRNAVIVWQVEESTDFKPGFPEYRQARVVISNQLTRPEWWGKWHEDNGLGSYSELKYRTFMGIVKVQDMTLETDGGTMNYSTMRAHVLEFKYWLQANPTPDEDGSLMQVAMRG